MDQPFWNILRCPETLQSLIPAEPDLLERINQRIRSGDLSNRAGEPVTQPIDDALVRTDRRYLYPVRDAIPVLLVDQGIPLRD